MNFARAMPMLIASSLLAGVALSACSSETPSAEKTETREQAAVPEQVKPQSPEKAPASAQDLTPAANTPPAKVTADTPINSENYAEVMAARAREYESAEWKQITLTGFSCGDNCYVEFTPNVEGGGDETALCSAKICSNWADAGKLPATFKNKLAEVKYGKATRIDGSGDKVDEYRNITEIRFPK
jgi:hypothetical protein